METISFEEFSKVDLRIGHILSAERIVESDKLLKLQVDLGEKNQLGEIVPHQVIAGIGKRYEPEFLVGKEVLMVANLAPRTLLGYESQGMIIAASDTEGPIIMLPERTTEAGTHLK